MHSDGQKQIYNTLRHANRSYTKNYTNNSTRNCKNMYKTNSKLLEQYYIERSRSCQTKNSGVKIENKKGNAVSREL